VDTLTTVGEFPALPADQPEPDGFIVRNTFVDFPVEGIVACTRPVHTIDCLPRAADPSEDAAPLEVSEKNSFLHVGLSNAEAAGMPMRLTQTQDSLPLLELSRLGPAHARMSASMASLPEFDTDEVRTSMLNEESKSMASLPGLDIHTVASLPDFHSMEGLLQLPGRTAAASDGQGLRVDTLTTVGELAALPADQPEPDGFIVRQSTS
jgi:hypothetical protein